MSIKMGTKYSCPSCKSEFIIMKATPNSSLTCCGKPVEKA